MAYLAAHPLLAVVVPAALGLVVMAGGRRAVRALKWIAVAGPLATALVGIAWLGGDRAAAAVQVDWLAQGGAVVTAGVALDALSAVMLVVVGLVSACVVVFSIGYMAEEDGQARYFSVISLFVGAMALLVTATSLVTLFVAWEVMGACSYLLIGFWYRKPSAADAAMKAFLVTRIGDVGLLFGLALLWRETGTLVIADVLAAAPALGAGVVTAAAALLFAGAVGKSAQFPLHVWLPDAMEGPTPVSALIHAATMVAAGVFLIARMWGLFEVAETVRVAIAAIGAVTALFSAMVAITQTDIKKVLAYSTISQLGFMFVALGAGVWQAALFHLVTHAAFKALLFLGSGSVIHATHTQDVREMGGLARRMPVTAATWCAGALALAGVPPLAGFFSKDAVLHAALGHMPLAGWALALASVLTALYATRVTLLVFFGEPRHDGAPHESPLVMTLPLVALGIGAVGLGAAAGPLAVLWGGEAGLDATVAAISVVASALGIGAGVALYRRGPALDTRLAEKLGGTYVFIAEAYRIDALYDRAVARPVRALARWLADRLDRRGLDRAVEGLPSLAERAGRLVASLQTGETDLYVALMAIGLVALIGVALWMGV